MADQQEVQLDQGQGGALVVSFRRECLLYNASIGYFSQHVKHRNEEMEFDNSKEKED